MTNDALDRTAVAAAIGPPLGDDVADGQATLEPVDVPGLGTGGVWRVHDEAGEHPWQAYVGAWPDGSVRVLTGDQDAWASLVAAAGIRLGSEAEARGYVEAFLEVTRGAMVIVRIISSLDDLRWRPGSDEEEAAKARLLADLPKLAPVVSATDDGFHVELTLVVDQRLQRNRFELTRDGEFTESSFRVYAEYLPLPIAR